MVLCECDAAVSAAVPVVHTSAAVSVLVILCQMISILDGIYMNSFLCMRTLAVKALGLTLAAASGLSLGREGTPLIV